MSYQVLARKWRPATFHQMQGQGHVLQALINGLDSGRLHHAYLFTGTRGVGKTSVARILAKCLNCERGVSSTPCGECGACIEIADNRFVDLIEVDAASRTKVEDTRELLENVQYAPSKGRFKIYLIDEVHMLSSHSFNALLKTLEEPPEHVKFLLATTDPQRLPATILSRCLQFSLKNLASETIVEHLTNILSQENVSSEPAALWSIARAASGSMRDALSLTDQAIAYGAGDIAEAQVRTMLGSIDRDTVCEVLDALVKHDVDAVLDLVEQMLVNGVDLESFLSDLLSSLHTVAVLQAAPNYRASALEHADRFKQLAGQLQAEDVQLYYQIALQAQRDAPFAPEPRIALEMALLRMLSFIPAQEAEELAPGAADKPQPEQAKQSPAMVSADPVPQAGEPPAGEKKKPEPPTPPKKPLAPIESVKPADWLDLFASLKLAGMARNVAANCQLRAVEGGQWLFCLDEQNCRLFQAGHVAQIESALIERLGHPVKVHLEPGQVDQETPYLREQRLQRERQQSAVDSIMSDPNVNALLETFDAQVDPESISPKQLGDSSA